MRHLLKSCTIIDAPSEKYHGKTYDILLDKGKIIQIADTINDTKARQVESKNLHCSIGWMDIGVHLGEPGNEQRETIESLCHAAQEGGYTDIVVCPNATPTIETKSQLQSLIHMGKAYGIHIHPLAPLSHKTEGKNISEYIDLHSGGAVGYSDGLQPVSTSGLLLRALQYARTTGAPVIHHPYDPSMAEGNNIHEGEMSIQLGMKGNPSLSESVVVDRDIRLATYAESSLVLHGISSGESVELIKQAKKTCENISSTVPYLNLLKTDTDLEDFDVNLKVDPPLRSKKDRTVLIRGIMKGSIDCIVSNHVPLEQEQKLVEYSFAHPGTTGLETCFAALNTFADKHIPLETLVDKITYGPRRAMKINFPTFEEGSLCPITVFDPSIEWTYTKESKKSISANNPFLGETLRGKAIMTFV